MPSLSTVSLRTRLVATTLALFTIGLVATAGATYGFLRTFLLRRVDQQLVAVQPTAVRAALEAAREENAGIPELRSPFAARAAGTRLIPPGTYVELRDNAGHVLASVSFGFGDRVPAPPTLPVAVRNPSDPAPLPSSPFTTGAEGSSDRYRVLAAGLDDGSVAVVAVPMGDADATLSRLLQVEAAVVLGVLLAIAATSLLLIRRGLRPLDLMGETAGAIADGDLSRRVEPAGGRTEIGRLGSSLNAMLGQIEAAFAERTASEQRLRRFLADASHELRTPLTSIRGWAELFRRGAATNPDDLARTMRRIEEEAAHMGVLVEDMLSLARLDEGRPLALEPVDLRRLATDAVDDLRAVDPARPVSLDVDGEPVVTGDATRLRQVLGNLLSNARYHTPAGTPVHVRVSTDGTTAVIEVADEGPGMPEDAAARAFERFFRSDPSRTRASGGAGLGLSIVDAIAKAHGGEASVVTAPGAGATFRVTIPVAGPRVQHPSPAQASTSPAVADADDGGDEAARTAATTPAEDGDSAVAASGS